MDTIQLLIPETNKYYNQYLSTLDNDNECSRFPVMTTGFWFLSYKQDMISRTH
jgi:hypothetical protein